MWDNLSKIFEHLSNKKKSANQGIAEYCNYSDFLPPEIQQRRSHLRVELFLPLNFWRVIRKSGTADPTDSALRSGEFQRIPTSGGMGLNISGNGVLILSAEEFSKDDYIEIDDKIFGRQMNIFAKIIRTGTTVFDNNRICEFAVKFIGISEIDYEYLVRSIFDKIKVLRKFNHNDYLREI